VVSLSVDERILRANEEVPLLPWLALPAATIREVIGDVGAEATSGPAVTTLCRCSVYRDSVA